MWRHRQLEEESLGTARFKSHAQAAVIVDSDVVASALHFGEIMAEAVERKGSASGANALRKIIVEAPVNESGDPAINGRFRVARFEDDIVLRPSDLCIRLQLMNRTIRSRMCQTKVPGHTRCLDEPSLFAGRELAQEISQTGIDVGLVEGGPYIAQIAEILDDSPRKALEQTDRLG